MQLPGNGRAKLATALLDSLSGVPVDGDLTEEFAVRTRWAAIPKPA